MNGAALALSTDAACEPEDFMLRPDQWPDWLRRLIASALALPEPARRAFELQSALSPWPLPLAPPAFAPLMDALHEMHCARAWADFSIAFGLSRAWSRMHALHSQERLLPLACPFCAGLFDEPEALP